MGPAALSTLFPGVGLLDCASRPSVPPDDPPALGAGGAVIPVCPEHLPGYVCITCGYGSECWHEDSCVLDVECPFVGGCLVVEARRKDDSGQSY